MMLNAVWFKGNMNIIEGLPQSHAIAPNYNCLNTTVSTWPDYGIFKYKFKRAHVSGNFLIQL